MRQHAPTWHWIEQCWRVQAANARALRQVLEEARQLGFNHYHSIRVKGGYWVSCIEAERGKRYADRLALIVERFKAHERAQILISSSDRLFWVRWNQGQLCGAIQLGRTAQDLAQLQTLWQLDGNQTAALPLQLIEAPEHPLAEQLEAAGIAFEAQQTPLGDTLKGCRRYRFKPLPGVSFWRPWQLLVCALVLVGLGLWLSFDLQQEAAAQAAPLNAEVAELRPTGLNMALASQLVAAIEELQSVSGWRLTKVQLQSDGKLSANYQADFATLAELQLQLDAVWQVSSSRGSALVEQVLVNDIVAPLRLADTWPWPQQTDAASQLPESVNLLLTQQYPLATEHWWQHQDHQLELTEHSWSDLLQLTHLSGAWRLLSFHYDVGASPAVTMNLRYYQAR